MLRREFILGAAAVACLHTGRRLGRRRAAAFEQGRIRRLDDGQSSGGGPKYLERRWDRYQVVISFNDLWTPADKRAF